MKAEPGFLETQLAVRRLAAALTATVFAFRHEVYCRRRHGFVHVAAADTAAVGTVQVALDDH